jgi:carboxyl-terminal processing protease
LQVTVFGDNTTAELDAALKQAQQDGAKGVILDLRNNGGGWVDSAQEMIGRFVPESSGPALYEQFDPDGSERTAQPIISGEVKMYDVPLIVLVNAGTASASEIVAGALRDYHRAEIVGERTFGKGSVQRVHDFQDGSSARITFAEWLTPSEGRIQGEGIEPDVVVDAGLDGASVDNQLLSAINVLTGGVGQDGESVSLFSTPAASPITSPIASPAA